MAKGRLSLQSLLENILGSGHVYFQPPPSFVMEYPCIAYERDDAAVQHANNLPYQVTTGYQVTYIDHDPDSAVIDKLLALPHSEFRRHFATSGLNHDVFMIYH